MKNKLILLAVIGLIFLVGTSNAQDTDTAQAADSAQSDDGTGAAATAQAGDGAQAAAGAEASSGAESADDGKSTEAADLNPQPEPPQIADDTNVVPVAPADNSADTPKGDDDKKDKTVVVTNNSTDAPKSGDEPKPQETKVANDTKVVPAAPGSLSDSKWYIPEVCQAASGECPTDKKRGCACYNNGTCSLLKSNTCAACALEDMLSYNEGAWCPFIRKNKLYACKESDKKATCPDTSPDLGCLCYADGTCERKRVDRCTGCAKENAVSVIESGHCPFKVFTKKFAPKNETEGSTTAKADDTKDAKKAAA